MSIQSVGSTQATSAQPDTQAQTLARTARSLQPSDTSASASIDGKTSASDTASTKPSGSSEELQEAVDSMNEFVQTLSNALDFSVDKETGQTVVKVVDKATGDVIKQIPSEEMLAIAKAIDKVKGLLIQQKA